MSEAVIQRYINETFRLEQELAALRDANERLKREAQAEARDVVQTALAWWMLRSEIRPLLITQFYEWVEEKWPWLTSDQDALLERLKSERKGEEGAQGG